MSRLAREAGTTTGRGEGPIPGAVLGERLEELANIVSLFASSEGWIEKVRLRSEGRWYERQYHGPDYDIWVISWLPGQSTGFHDHGASSGAFVVATGILEEHRPGVRTRVIHPGKPRAFGPDYAHDVRNASLAPAISIHAYSPPLSEMNEYELDGSQLVPRERASGETETLNQESSVQKRKPLDRTGALSIEQVLLAARARTHDGYLQMRPMRRWSKQGRYSSIFVPKGQRAIEGSIAGALVVERNVLEWRFDPASSARLPVATDHEHPGDRVLFRRLCLKPRGDISTGFWDSAARRIWLVDFMHGAQRVCRPGRRTASVIVIRNVGPIAFVPIAPQSGRLSR